MPTINATSMLVGDSVAVAAYYRGADVAPLLLPNRVRSILNKYGAAMLLPGVSGVLRFGYQPGNYRESTGQTLAGADQQVGLVVDAARSPGPELVVNGDFSAGATGWSDASTAPSSVAFSVGMAVLTRIGSDNARLDQPIPTVSGRTYRIRAYIGTQSLIVTAGPNQGSSALLPTLPLMSSNGSREVVFTASSSTTWIRFITTGSGSCSIDNISVRELPGIHASQSTSGFQPVLRNTAGIQSWQFDGSDDRFSMTFPSGAGWNNTTIITARSSGAVTETGQNVEGTHLFQISGHVYGRFYIPNGSTISASELAALQRFANVLSGYSA